MKKFLFIGIDFSKSKFDVTALEDAEQQNVAQATFENNQNGYADFLKWISQQSVIDKKDWLFCGEHTGLYSRGLSEFLIKKKLFIWLENPLQIKSSTGIKREKNDLTDSREIAQYACRFNDRAKASYLFQKEIDSLRLLLGYRNRLVKNKVVLQNAANETRSVLKRDTAARFIFERSQMEIKRLEKEIKSIELKMHQTMMNSDVKENYLLALSVKGVGLITTVAFIVHTDNFRAFETVQQLACYCGVAPFEKSSGKCLKRPNRISNLANKDLKVLLTECARCAVMYDKELLEYYNRKLAEGKNERIIINNVRCKLVHRIFAVVKHKIPYRTDYLNPCGSCA